MPFLTIVDCFSLFWLFLTVLNVFDQIDYFWPFWPFFTVFDRFDCIDRCWLLLKVVDRFGPFLTVFFLCFGPLLSIFDRIDHCWPFLTTFDHFWPLLFLFDQFWHFWSNITHVREGRVLPVCGTFSFRTHILMVLVLLSASVERFGVSCMRDFFFINLILQRQNRFTLFTDGHSLIEFFFILL